MTQDDLDFLIKSAVRYAIGRMTYMPDVVCRFSSTLLPHLSIEARQELIDLVENWERRGRSYGMAEDRQTWLAFLHRLKEVGSEVSLEYPKIDVQDDDFGCLLTCAIRANLYNYDQCGDPSHIIAICTPLLLAVDARTIWAAIKDIEDPIGQERHTVDSPWSEFYDALREEDARRDLQRH